MRAMSVALLALLLGLAPGCTAADGGAPETNAASSPRTSAADRGGISRHHALLVACTKYWDLPTGKWLSGPKNDVILMRELLKSRFGLRDEEIVTLAEHLDEDDLRPKRANIVREFEALIERVQPGDHVTILLAGHGSQAPDDPESPDEEDGLDELFLPSDIRKWNGRTGEVENAIRDDEIGQWLARLEEKGAYVFLIADACHSGTLIRGSEVSRQLLPDDLGIPNSELAQSRRRATSVEESRDAIDIPTKTSRVVALYAAQSHEVAPELPLPDDAESPENHGLLTYTVGEILSRTTEPITYRELAQRVHREYVRRGRSSPTPLLQGAEAELDRAVLGIDLFEGRSRITLTRRRSELTISVGSLHGMTAGSVLRVYPAAGAEGADAPLGHVRVVDPQPLTSRVRPVEFEGMPAVSDLPDGGRCEVVLHDLGAFRLAVAVDEDATTPASPGARDDVLSAIRTIAEQSGSFVTPLDTTAGADWLVRVAGDEAFLIPAEGIGVPEGVAADVGALRDRPLYGPFAIDGSLPETLGEALKKIAKARNLLALTTDDGRGGVQSASVQVRCVLERKAIVGGQSQWTEVAWDGGRTLNDGDEIRFRIHNPGTVTADVTLLFIDSDYGIVEWYPGSFAVGRLAPDAEVVTMEGTVGASHGLEHMLLIAVRAEPQQQPVRFGWLAQPALDRQRDLPSGPRSPLEELLLTAGFSEGGVRSLKATAISSHTVQVISWKVRPDDAP